MLGGSFSPAMGEERPRQSLSQPYIYIYFVYICSQESASSTFYRSACLEERSTCMAVRMPYPTTDCGDKKKCNLRQIQHPDGLCMGYISFARSIVKCTSGPKMPWLSSSPGAMVD